jgi:predicted membrane channel-forming protein YqfA (hemolysin III family)
MWCVVGLAGMAVFVAARSRAVPRWLGIVGLVLGGLTVVLGVSPLEYMSGVTGVLWLLVTAVGFTVGDRSHRGASRTAR